MLLVSPWLCHTSGHLFHLLVNMEKTHKRVKILIRPSCPADVVMVAATLVETASSLRFSQSFQNLQQVPQDIPEEVTTVYLQGNNISDIKPGTFSELVLCEDLALSSNQLTEVRADMWEGLLSLKYLVLDNNKIGHISPDGFCTLPSLSGLTLERNKITIIQTNMFTCISLLTELYLSENPIQSIESGSFRELPQLIKLNLAHAKLTAIRASMFEGLHSLEILKLDNCKLSDITAGTFVHTHQLNFLSLMDNQISQLNHHMWEGAHLGVIHLKNNGIQRINGDMWEGLENLWLLDLESNPIRYISPQMWHGLDKIIHLDLTNISISFVPPNCFQNLPELNRLQLGANRLQTLHFNIFGSNHPEEVYVGLGGNPLQCDSRLCWMQEAEEEGWFHATETLYFDRPQCANFPGTSWDDTDLGCVWNCEGSSCDFGCCIAWFVNLWNICEGTRLFGRCPSDCCLRKWHCM